MADYCRRHLASVPAHAWHSLMRRRRRFPICSQYPLPCLQCCDVLCVPGWRRTESSSLSSRQWLAHQETPSSRNNQANLTQFKRRAKPFDRTHGIFRASRFTGDRNRPEETMTLTQKNSPVIQRPASYNDREPLILCPITRHPCKGDLAYLCEDYGCARKGGLSPHSNENL